MYIEITRNLISYQTPNGNVLVVVLFQ